MTQYIYTAFLGCIVLETLAIVILAKVCKKRKQDKREAEQLAETYKSMYDKQEAKIKNINSTIKKLKEARREEVDVDSMSNADIKSVLSGV